MFPCSWKEALGIDCPMCGSQRSFVSLMNGNLSDSLEMFPALIPLMLTFLITILHLYFKWKYGAKTIVVLFSITVIMMVSNFIAKL